MRGRRDYKAIAAALRDTLSRRVMILDGAFGTMLQSCGCDSKACNDLLCVTRPELVEDIHRAYLEAGADIIETNSFNANAISLADYGLSDRAREIARAAARVARRAADAHSTPERQRYVAGSMGPTNRTLSMSADITDPGARALEFTDLYNAYRDQARGLIEGGADILLVETVFDTLNAKAALAAIRDESEDIPVMVSCTVSDASGRLLTGQTVEAFCASVMHVRPLSIGLNCGFGARHLLPFLRRLAAAAPVYVSVHPNAGLPNVDGGYDETPAMFHDDIEEYFREGLVNIVGGCCGTTPAHIAAIAPLSGIYPPRRLTGPDGVCTLSGLEPLRLVPEANLINVGERTNVAGSARFARLIREGDYAQALSIARAQVEAGAQIVDVCMDHAMIDGVEAMTHFLRLVASEPDIARVPLMIDSSSWDVIEAGLQNTQGKCIVNSISLKEGEEEFLRKARRVMRYGAAVVVMLFDERGQADTCSRKIEVADRAYKLLTGIGFPPEDIIIDPNILAVATGMPEHDRYARDFIDATAWIKATLPGAKVSGGVSNLSFSFRGNDLVRRAMHSAFLYHAVKAGMDMAIVNPQMVLLYDDIPADLLERVEDVILYRRPDASERLIQAATSLAALTAGGDTAPQPGSAPASTASERIARAMLTGDISTIQADTLEAYSLTGSAVAVVSDILMPAMEQVGTLFGEGRMFLPQVVKSARVMKMAVAVLEPYFNAAGDAAAGQPATRGHVVLATVKGDVHDIGKNIVGVVLACNGFTVHDLGTMVPPEDIIDAARQHNAAAICLSGLITPSLNEMINVIRCAAREGLDIPVIVGGATTSALHTALKMAPEATFPVIHSTDAAHNASILVSLTSPGREAFIADNSLRQQHLAGR